MKKLFYILLLTGFSYAGFSQAKSTPLSDVVRVVKVYPNPATSFVNFEFEKNYDASHTITIFNFIGKKVEDVKVTDQKMNVSLADFYRGIYIYQLRDKQGNIVASGKFQVVK